MSICFEYLILKIVIYFLQSFSLCLRSVNKILYLDLCMEICLHYLTTILVDVIFFQLGSATQVFN